MLFTWPHLHNVTAMASWTIEKCVDWSATENKTSDNRKYLQTVWLSQCAAWTLKVDKILAAPFTFTPSPPPLPIRCLSICWFFSLHLHLLPLDEFEWWRRLFCSWLAIFSLSWRWHPSVRHFEKIGSKQKMDLKSKFRSVIDSITHNSMWVCVANGTLWWMFDTHSLNRPANRYTQPHRHNRLIFSLRNSIVRIPSMQHGTGLIEPIKLARKMADVPGCRRGRHKITTWVSYSCWWDIIFSDIHRPTQNIIGRTCETHIFRFYFKYRRLIACIFKFLKRWRRRKSTQNGHWWWWWWWLWCEK